MLYSSERFGFLLLFLPREDVAFLSLFLPREEGVAFLSLFLPREEAVGDTSASDLLKNDKNVFFFAGGFDGLSEDQIVSQADHPSPSSSTLSSGFSSPHMHGRHGDFRDRLDPTQTKQMRMPMRDKVSQNPIDVGVAPVVKKFRLKEDGGIEVVGAEDG